MSTTLRALLVLTAMCGFATAAPYGADGMEIQWNQPGNKALTLRVFGDEFYGRTETTDGYTVILDRSNLTYYYAALSRDGKSLFSTRIPADRPAPAGFAKHVDIPVKAIRQIAKTNRNAKDNGRLKRWSNRVQAIQTLRDFGGRSVRGVSPEIAAASALAAPVVGNKVGLTILVQFPGEGSFPPIPFPATRAKIERFCNEEGYSDNGNTGSVRDYFFDQSLGQLTYTQTVTKVVTMPRPRDYYNFEDFPLNRTIYDDAGISGRLLLTDALNALVQDGFDFSSLSTDSANSVLATNIFFAGSNSGIWAAGLWPHQSALMQRFNVGTAEEPMFINNYQITNIENSAPVIGTFCHENGHLLLDYPDYYSLVGEGVGDHCLMGGGSHLDNGRTPAPINAYLKDMVGWATVTELAIKDYVTASLPASGNVAYRIRNPKASTEFYVVENRGGSDRWAKYVPDKGIAIWHIDQTVLRGNILNDPHYEISLMQADGKNHLENDDVRRGNRGDAQDLYDLKTPLFSPNTTPNSNWWNGDKSGVRVQALSPAAKSMDVRFGAVPPDTIIVSSPNGGEVIFAQSKYPIEWEANIKGNVKIDLLKDGTLLQNIVADAPNSGSYEWNVPKGLSSEGDYTILVSSLTNAKPATDASDAAFHINNTTFPAADARPHGWAKPAFAKTSFKVTKSNSYEGTSALKSGPMGDGQTAAIAYTSDFHQGNVSFYYRVSSEHDYDIARFYIDGVAQTLGFDNGISGREGWKFFTFPLSAGIHTLMWTYEKDTSYAGGGDAAWLDGVTLPATTQKIAIQDGAGNDMASGAVVWNFPDTMEASASQSSSFTIKNTGNADLTGLKLGLFGQHADDFKLGKFKTRFLAPGESATFKVAFSPRSAGAKTADLRVFSDDASMGKFVIDLTGNALGRPILGVEYGSKAVASGQKGKSFGLAFVGTEGRTRKYTIVNNGAGSLENLSVSVSGDSQDFLVSGPSATSVAPGASTSFKVTFAPTTTGVRTGTVLIASNDSKSGTFQMPVKGEGVPQVLPGKSAGSAAVAAAAPKKSKKSGAAAASTSVEVIGGKKYVSLTVKKPAPGISAKSVEVSPDLLNWSSGRRHTTVLIDNAKTLKVRDNTPVTKNSKRHIRLR